MNNPLLNNSIVYYKIHSNKDDTEDIECSSFENAIKTAKEWSSSEPDTEIIIKSIKIDQQDMFGYKNGKVVW